MLSITINLVPFGVLPSEEIGKVTIINKHKIRDNVYQYVGIIGDKNIYFRHDRTKNVYVLLEKVLRKYNHETRKVPTDTVRLV